MKILILPAVFVLSLGSILLSQDAEKGPERWKSDIAAFSDRDTTSPSPDNALLFVGSSSIRLWELDQSWPDQDTINNGFGGSTMADMIHYFDALFLPHRPRAIILYGGDNDIHRGLSAKGARQDFETLASSITASFPDVPVIFLAIKPSLKRWEIWPTMEKANGLIADLCSRNPRWYFADTATPMLEGVTDAPDSSWFVEDGLHLSEEGYERWTAIVNEILREAEAKP